jgi:RimJ/RimL family protein N-acetyltransferase
MSKNAKQETSNLPRITKRVTWNSRSVGSMISDRELMKIQVEVLFTQDENGCLLGLNEPDGDAEPAPRFFLGYTNEGSICRFRFDLPENVEASLKEVAAAEPMLMDSQTVPRSHDPFKDILQSHAPIERVWVGPAYRFPERIAPPANVVRLSPENADLLKGDFAQMVPELNDGRPYLAVIEDSQAVSICRSVRLSSRAHEAGVDTLDAYRRRGYATSVVAAWALAVRSLNLIPLYSTSWDNVASQGVAQRLGLVQYGVDYHVT